VTPADLSALLYATTVDVLSGRGIGTDALPAAIDWSRAVTPPGKGGTGEYATSVALRAAPALELAPRELAAWLADALRTHPTIEAAEVTGPGFVNLTLAPSARHAVLARILREGDRYGGPHRQAETDGELDEARYVHARMSALVRHAAALDVPLGERYELLTEPAERALIRVLAEFPTARRLGAYLRRLAGAGHAFDASCRTLPMGDEPTTELHKARRALVEATRQVLANGLRGLGQHPPERM
jgi:arginyl-tRNA synthetase